MLLSKTAAANPPAPRGVLISLDHAALAWEIDQAKIAEKTTEEAEGNGRNPPRSKDADLTRQANGKVLFSCCFSRRSYRVLRRGAAALSFGVMHSAYAEMQARTLFRRQARRAAWPLFRVGVE